MQKVQNTGNKYLHFKMIGEEHQLLWEPESQGQADTPEHVQQPFGVHEFLNKQRRANTLIIKLTGTLPCNHKLFGIDNLQGKLTGVKKVINKKNEVQVIRITSTSTSIA